MSAVLIEDCRGRIMPKKIAVDGLDVWINENDYEKLRNKFKETVTVDDLQEWQSEEDMEKYTSTTLIEKARNYLAKSPSDIVQSAEKTWFAAVFAVKELYLTAGGIDLKSHSSLKYFCQFALDSSGLNRDQGDWKLFWKLFECWTNAEKLHQDVYGSSNFHTSDYTQIISDVEVFVLEFAKIDRTKLYAEFQANFISKNHSSVDVRKEPGYVKLGGFNFKRNYSVYV